MRSVSEQALAGVSFQPFTSSFIESIAAVSVDVKEIDPAVTYTWIKAHEEQETPAPASHRVFEGRLNAANFAIGPRRVKLHKIAVT